MRAEGLRQNNCGAQSWASNPETRIRHLVPPEPGTCHLALGDVAGVVRGCPGGYGKDMVTIRFADSETKRRALGFLAGRFSFTTWASGEVLVPDPALSALAHEGISFTVEGPPTYGQAVPTLRNAPSTSVQ